MKRESTDGVLVEDIPEGMIDCNLGFIKKLTKDLMKTSPEELFFSVVLYETYTFKDEIDKLTLKDVQWIAERYREYLMDKDASLISPRWLKK